MSELAVDAKEKKEVEKEALALISQAEALVIRSNQDYEIAAEIVKGAAELSKKIKEKIYGPIKKAIDSSKKVVLEQEKEQLAPALKVRQILEQKMIQWKKSVAKKEAKSKSLVVKHEDPVVSGISMRRYPKFRVVDVDKIDRKFLVPDNKKIGAVVRSMGEDAVGVVGGGIEVYFEEGLSVRS